MQVDLCNGHKTVVVVVAREAATVEDFKYSIMGPVQSNHCFAGLVSNSSWVLHSSFCK